MDAVQASLAANGRSGSVVEGLVDRTDLISRGDSRGGGKADTSLVANLQGVHVPRRDGNGFLGGGDNLDAVQAILAANGRSGSVVEGLVGRSDLISRGDSRGGGKADTSLVSSDTFLLVFSSISTQPHFTFLTPFSFMLSLIMFIPSMPSCSRTRRQET